MMIPGGGSFSVESPQAPKSLPTQGGAGTDTWVIELDKDSGYVVGVFVLPVEANTRRFLEAALKASAVKTASGQWESVEWKQHQGLPAVDAIGKTRSGRDIRIYSVVKNTRVFTLTCTGLAGSARTGDINRFIASLKIQ